MPINVAKVRQLSPFRYPGGKTWLVPYVRRWLRSRPARYLIEPFAGGGIVSLTAIFDDLVERATIVELDEGVAAVWRTILSDNGGADWLAKRILEFRLTKRNVAAVLDAELGDEREQAFATILRNRCQRGGILAPGAGLMKEGENGRGLRSRWYADTLAARIEAIAQRRHRITFLKADGFRVMTEHVGEQETALFVDPPYTIAAKRLYVHWKVDHGRLFDLVGQVRGDFLMTYDLADEILALARLAGFKTARIAMKNTHHAVMDELLIGRDLSWL